MTSNGSNVNHTYIRKAPDHQRVAVAKIKPFSMLTDERVRTMTPNATTPSSVVNNNTAYFEKGFKTFKDFK